MLLNSSPKPGIKLIYDDFRYVKLEYYPKNSVSEAKKLLSTEGNDFVEGIMFGKNRVVVMFGNYTDKVEPGRVSTVTVTNY